MRIDTTTVEVLVLSAPETKRAQDYDQATGSRSDKNDKKTGLPVWTVRAEVFDTEDGRALFVGNLKVVSEKEPELSARSVYKIEGALDAVAYTQTSGSRANAAVSYTVRGSLLPLATTQKLPPVKHN